MQKKFKIRKINDKGEHGMWKEMICTDFTQEWKTEKGLEDLAKHEISGYYLMAHGWERSQSTYKKGNDLITYNGTEWFLNGKEIKSINEIP